MSVRHERQVVRRLSEKRSAEPPPGLLGRIVADIPVAVVVGDDVARPEEVHRRLPSGRRWLIAASLLALVW